MFIGNDIIDLNEIAHLRFLERICSGGEFEVMRIHKINPWVVWAIKEASYKALKKFRADICFIPKYFSVRINPWCCEYFGLELDLIVHQTLEFVHAIAVHPSLLPKRLYFNQCIRNGSLSESQDVRALCLQILHNLGYADCHIVNKPPQVIYQNEILEEVDISLSHDGRFVAAAVILKASR